MSRGHWCETAALLPHVPGMGLGPWLWGDLQEREQRAQVDEGAEMKGDEKLHGGLGSCRALASQDGQHPTPTAGTENTPPPPPRSIPMATTASPFSPPSHSHGNCRIPPPCTPFPWQLQHPAPTAGCRGPMCGAGATLASAGAHCQRGKGWQLKGPWGPSANQCSFPLVCWEVTTNHWHPWDP